MSDFSAEFILPAVREVVVRAGDIIRDRRNRPGSISRKGRIDLVTETDLAVEDFLKRYLYILHPADFLAEESSPGQKLDKSAWIIDPLDGTTNFAHGLPMVSTSVALWIEGNIELGIVNMPLLGECYWAVRGGGAFCNGRKIHVSSIENLDDALVTTGFPYNIQTELSGVLKRLESVLPLVQGVRRCGSAAMDLAYVACGRYDAFYETGLKPWDIAAGMLLVEESGGKFSHIEGGAFSFEHSNILASNKILHEKMLKCIN